METMKTKPPKRSRLVVGLDFGTSHTGISFSMTGREAHFNIDKWPAFDGSEVKARKTPTQIVYPTPQESTFLWGYQVESQAGLCAWMKYHLDHDSPETQYDDPKLRDAMKGGLLSVRGKVDAEQVTTDYLREVFKFTVAQLEKKFNRSILKVTAINWWLAKPAIWGGQAQLRLQRIVKKAAEEANLGGSREKDEFNFISEPEAAAFSFLGETRELEDKFQEGNVILVCDCGGGTVDVAVYKVVSTSPSTEFEEVISAQGGKCGSAFLDRLFQSWMADTFGSSYESVGDADKMTGSKFMKAFETNKRQFNNEGRPLRDMPLSMPGVDKRSQYYHQRDEQVMLTERVMRDDIFEPVVQCIMSLIKDQEKAARSRLRRARVTDMLLVGGLARSVYLQSSVKEWCSEKRIRLRLPNNESSWGAVSHGAMLRGLGRAKIERRISSLHYGILCNLPFDERQDKPEELYIHPLTHDHLIQNCVLWFVKAGTVVDKNSFCEHELYRELEEGQPEFSERIVSCREKRAPRRMDPEVVQKVGKLVVRLRGVEVERFRFKSKTGASAGIKFDYMIQQSMGQSEGTILFNAITSDRLPLGYSEVSLPQMGSRAST